MTLNLIKAAWDVSNGRISTGDFVMIQTLFLQLAGPLHNVGSLIREVDQGLVDSEDLFEILNEVPKVQEKPDAKEFEFKNG